MTIDALVLKLERVNYQMHPSQLINVASGEVLHLHKTMFAGPTYLTLSTNTSYTEAGKSSKNSESVDKLTALYKHVDVEYLDYHVSRYITDTLVTESSFRKNPCRLK